MTNKFYDYQEAAKRTMSDDDPAIMCCLGLFGESGELVEMIKKHEFHSVEPDRDAMVKEIGDVLFYLTNIASIYDISLGHAAKVNTEKLKARYPDGFVKGGGVRGPDPKTSERFDIGSVPLRDAYSLNLIGKRVYGAFRCAGLKTVGDLQGYRLERLTGLKNVGRWTMKRAERFLDDCNQGKLDHHFETQSEGGGVR